VAIEPVEKNFWFQGGTMHKNYSIIGGHGVCLDTRVGKVVKVYRFDRWEKCLVLPFRKVIPVTWWDLLVYSVIAVAVGSIVYLFLLAKTVK